MSDAGYPAWQDAFGQNNPMNAISFMIRQMMAQASHVSLVVVKNVTANADPNQPPTVDVQPMVHQVDQKGNAQEHGTIHKIPTYRFQAGTAAFVADPRVGDIGVVICADRDISSAVSNQAPSNPGSFRRFDWADSLYLGGFGLVAPTTKIVVDQDDGVTITTDQNVTVNATGGNVTVNADEIDLISDTVNLGATGGEPVARVGDSVDLTTGLITTGSSKVSAA